MVWGEQLLWRLVVSFGPYHELAGGYRGVTTRPLSLASSWLENTTPRCRGGGSNSAVWCFGHNVLDWGFYCRLGVSVNSISLFLVVLLPGVITMLSLPIMWARNDGFLDTTCCFFSSPSAWKKYLQAGSIFPVNCLKLLSFGVYLLVLGTCTFCKSKLYLRQNGGTTKVHLMTTIAHIGE